MARKEYRTYLDTKTVNKHTQEEYAENVKKCWSNYDYKKAMERAHYKGKPAEIYTCQTTPTISVDEMTELYGSADFLGKALEVDPSHYENKIIAKVDAERAAKRKAEREPEINEKYLNSKPLSFRGLSHIKKYMGR